MTRYFCAHDTIAIDLSAKPTLASLLIDVFSLDFTVFAFSNRSTEFSVVHVYLQFNKITPNTKNASITTADQLTSQPIRGIPVGSIPAKVVSVDCIHVKGLSIKRELLLPAMT